MTRPRQKPDNLQGMPCARCGRPSTGLWQVQGLWIAFCRDCDLELNARVLDFARVEGREAMIRAYMAREAS